MKNKFSKMKNSPKSVCFFKVGVEKVRKKLEMRKCSLTLIKLKTEDIKLIQ